MDKPEPKQGAGTGLRPTLGLLRGRNGGWWFGGLALQYLGLRTLVGGRVVADPHADRQRPAPRGHRGRAVVPVGC